MIAELERGEDDTYREITGGSLFAAADDVPDSIGTPEAVGKAEATPDAAMGSLSTARRFVLDLQTQLESLSGQEPSQFPQLLIELDTLAHDRQALQEFIDSAFPQPEQAETRATFLSAIDAMSDADVQEVFAVVTQTITLEDSKIAGQTVAQYYSIECNERLPVQSFANTVRNAQLLEIPDLALGKPEALAKVFAICEQWPSGRAPAAQAEPVWSEVPTLILSGAYDNLTPVSWNKSAFVTLPNGVFVLTPMSGHAVITYSTCAEQVGQAFIANPDEAPDTSCIADLETQWVLPSSDEVSDAAKATPSVATANRVVG